MSALGPAGLGLLLVATFAAIGILPVRKFLSLVEARGEMREGSTSRLRALRGWSFIAVWAVLTCFSGSLVGDWARSGDLDGALDRAGHRAWAVIEIVAIIMASDQ